MGQAFVKLAGEQARHLEAGAPPEHVQVRLGDSHFVAFVAPPTLKANAQDLLISVRILNGALEAIYVAVDERFPLSTRKLWTQDRVSLCPQPDCDHALPECRTLAGGFCPGCMLVDPPQPDQPRGRVCADPKLSRLAASLDAQKDGVMALRLRGADTALQLGKRYWLTVSASGAAPCECQVSLQIVRGIGDDGAPLPEQPVAAAAAAGGEGEEKRPAVQQQPAAVPAKQSEEKKDDSGGRGGGDKPLKDEAGPAGPKPVDKPAEAVLFDV